MNYYGLRYEFPRHVLGRLGCTRIRKQDVGGPRNQKDVCEESNGGRGDGIATGQKWERGVANGRRIGIASRERESVCGGLHLAGTTVRRATKVGKEDEWSELWRSHDLHPCTSAKLRECCYEVR